MQCLRGLRFKKHIIFHILYIIVAPHCPAFLKLIDFYKAQHSEKRGLIGQLSSALWLAEYLKREMEMLCPLTIFGNTQRLHNENKSYAFFLCVNIWPVLCKSSNTVT